MYKHKTISTKNHDSDDDIDDNINVTITKYKYKVEVVGILSNVSTLVEDTTGAGILHFFFCFNNVIFTYFFIFFIKGDSFIAGYILMRTLHTTSNTIFVDVNDESISIKVCLLFATWVAGNKIQGIGTK